jgi:hypothetical protein
MHTDTNTTTVFNAVFEAPHAGEAGVALRRLNDDTGYVLEWTDFVANDWSETFPNMSTALARLALLAYCCETDWDATFKNDSKDFFLNWVDFAESAVN